MTFEFEKDSKELADFIVDLKHIESSDADWEEYYIDFESIYQKTDGRYFCVSERLKKGIRAKKEFMSHRKDFKKDNPYIVTFVEVSPVEETVIRWHQID